MLCLVVVFMYEQMLLERLKPLLHAHRRPQQSAHVLLERLKPLLQAHRRPQQSGFTPGRSTADAILALRLLVELHREFQRPLHVA